MYLYDTHNPPTASASRVQAARPPGNADSLRVAEPMQTIMNTWFPGTTCAERETSRPPYTPFPCTDASYRNAMLQARNGGAGCRRWVSSFPMMCCKDTQRTAAESAEPRARFSTLPGICCKDTLVVHIFGGSTHRVSRCSCCSVGCWSACYSPVRLVLCSVQKIVGKCPAAVANEQHTNKPVRSTLSLAYLEVRHARQPPESCCLRHSFCGSSFSLFAADESKAPRKVLIDARGGTGSTAPGRPVGAP